MKQNNKISSIKSKLYENNTLKKTLGIFLTIVVPVVSTVVTTVVGAYYNTEPLEAFLITIITLFFGFISWIVVTFLLKQINGARDSISDNETQEIQKLANIRESERCTHFTDVCSISRALAKPGLKIAFDEEKKSRYKLYTQNEFLKTIDGNDSNLILYTSDVVECEFSEEMMQSALVSKITNNHHLMWFRFDFNPQKKEVFNIDNPNITFEQIYSYNSNDKIDSLLLANYSFIFVEDKNTKVIYDGYIILAKSEGFIPLFYKMPRCMLLHLSQIVKDSMVKNILLKNKDGKEVNFIFKKIDKSYLNEVIELNKEIVNENISNDIFTPPTIEEINDSFDYDTVIGVFDKYKLVAFEILISRNDKSRNLTYLLMHSYDYDYISIDNVEVKKEYRGFSLEKNLLLFAEEMFPKHKYIAVVSIKNKYSYNNFKLLNYKVEKEVDIYNSKRLLVNKD